MQRTGSISRRLSVEAASSLSGELRKEPDYESPTTSKATDSKVSFIRCMFDVNHGIPENAEAYLSSIASKWVDLDNSHKTGRITEEDHDDKVYRIIELLREVIPEINGAAGRKRNRWSPPKIPLDRLLD